MTNMLIVTDDLPLTHMWVKPFIKEGKQLIMVDKNTEVTGGETDEVYLIQVSDKESRMFAGSYLSEERKQKWFRACVFAEKGPVNTQFKTVAIPQFKTVQVIAGGHSVTIDL